MDQSPQIAESRFLQGLTKLTKLTNLGFVGFGSGRGGRDQDLQSIHDRERGSKSSEAVLGVRLASIVLNIETANPCHS
jgi:hypothetical protein